MQSANLEMLLNSIDVIATRQAYDDDSNARCNTLGGSAAVDYAARGLNTPATKVVCKQHEDEIITTRDG